MSRDCAVRVAAGGKDSSPFSLSKTNLICHNSTRKTLSPLTLLRLSPRFRDHVFSKLSRDPVKDHVTRSPMKVEDVGPISGVLPGVM